MEIPKNLKEIILIGGIMSAIIGGFSTSIYIYLGIKEKQLSKKASEVEAIVEKTERFSEEGFSLFSGRNPNRPSPDNFVNCRGPAIGGG